LDYLFVFLGGGLGSMSRHAINQAMLKWGPAGFPFSTLLINVVGSLLMGLLAGLFLRYAADVSANARLFLATGFLGGFTTFSTYALEIVMLQQRASAGIALAYALGSVVLGVAAVVVGMALAK
jgi:CrcB protein